MRILNCVLLMFVCLCAKAQAENCTVNEDGCLWTCTQPEGVHCLAKIVVPTTCEIGSSETLCGSTCTCSRAKGTVGVNGCKWNCVDKPNIPGQVRCFAIELPPSQCYPCEKFSDCEKT